MAAQSKKRMVGLTIDDLIIASDKKNWFPQDWNYMQKREWVRDAIKELEYYGVVGHATINK